MTQHHLASGQGAGMILEVTPEIAGWDSLHFAVEALAAGGRQRVETADREVAIVPLVGAKTREQLDIRHRILNRPLVQRMTIRPRGEASSSAPRLVARLRRLAAGHGQPSRYRVRPL